MHYKIIIDGSEDRAVDCIRDGCFFDLYNSYFHFDTDRLVTKLKVRIFKDKAGFNEYLNRIIGQPADSFVYLQYNNPKEASLVGFIQNDETFKTSLIHHGLIQFVKVSFQTRRYGFRKGWQSALRQVLMIIAKKAVYKRINWADTFKNLVKGAGAPGTSGFSRFHFADN